MKCPICSALVVFVSLLIVPLAHADSKSEKKPVQYRLRQIFIEPVPSPEQEGEVLNRAVECLNRAKEGEDFILLARKYSQEPGAERTGGDLGFFTADQMLKPFSETVFSMKPGEIRGPVKTQYGYHIIRLLGVHGKRRHAQHILFTLIPSHADSIIAFKTVRKLWNQLDDGADFGELFEKSNMNDELRKTDGYMVWQKPDEMLEEFQKAVAGLKQGEFSQPFASILGYHVVMVDSINYDLEHILQGFPAQIERRLKEQKPKDK